MNRAATGVSSHQHAGASLSRAVHPNLEAVWCHPASMVTVDIALTAGRGWAGEHRIQARPWTDTGKRVTIDPGDVGHKPAIRAHSHILEERPEVRGHRDRKASDREEKE